MSTRVETEDLVLPDYGFRLCAGNMTLHKFIDGQSMLCRTVFGAYNRRKLGTFTFPSTLPRPIVVVQERPSMRRTLVIDRDGQHWASNAIDWELVKKLRARGSSFHQDYSLNKR